MRQRSGHGDEPRAIDGGVPVKVELSGDAAHGKSDLRVGF
jgi:hypothetical protein